MKNRVIHSTSLTEATISLLSQISFTMGEPVLGIFRDMMNSETSETARHILNVLIENDSIAKTESIPLCQDCGMVMAFIEIGQQVVIDGDLHDAVNEGVSQAYTNMYLRSSMVDDPLRRNNTGDNTPALIHTEVVPGETLSLTLYLKGGGSENMSRLKMFRPTTTEEEIIDFIVGHVVESGPNPCPPLFLGIGIGGSSDTAMLNSKKALFRGIDTLHPDSLYRDLEERILLRLNETGVGPLGLGGRSTACGVNIIAAPTHIATLPVALNLGCHSFRFGKAVL